MSDSSGGPAQNGPSGFLQPLRDMVAALSSALHTRLELFATELEEERERLKSLLVLTFLVIFGLSFGLILCTIFLVALFWEHGWIAAIGGLALLYLAVGVVSWLKLRSAILRRPGLFPATLAELGKDRDQLRASRRE